MIDTKKDTSVHRGQRLHIPVVAWSTQLRPDLVDFVIPGNDDAIRSAH